jgi:hypothetical protein
VSDDLQTAITTFFVQKREHGTTLSSADTQYLLRLEQKNAPISVVIDGIEQAFRSKKDPPLSLSDCKRWINAALKKADGPAIAEQFPAQQTTHSSTDGQPRGQNEQNRAFVAPATSLTLEDRLLQRLRNLEARANTTGAAAACAELDREFTDMVQSNGGSLPPDTIDVLDDALVQLLLKHEPAAFARLDVAPQRVNELDLTAAERQSVLAHFGLGSILAI